MNILSSTISKLSRRERTVFWSAFGAAVLSLLALAISYLIGHSQAQPADGGIYREAIVGQPSMLNPVLAESPADQNINRVVFLPLSDLAEQIAPEAGGGLKTWRVRLRQDVMWQDGQKLTADDVIFTLDKIQDPSELSPLFNRWQYIQAKRLSELEILFTLPAPYSFFGEYLKNFTPIPQHLWEDMPLANWHLSPLILKPVGDGPYEFESMDQQSNGFISRYGLKRSSRYSGEPAKIDKINFLFFHSVQEAIQEFNRGGADGWWAENPEQLANLNRPYQTKQFRLPSYYAIFMNASKNSLLADKYTRQTLAQTIDIKSAVEDVFKDTAQPIYNLSQVINGTGTAEDTSGSLPSQLSATSSRNNGTEGWDLTLTASNLPQDDQLAKDLINNWAKAGINVKLISISPKDLAQETVPNRDYQMLLYTQNVFPTQDLWPFWHSRERFAPGENLSLYANSGLDSLLDTSRTSNSSSSRESALAQAIQVIDNDQPVIFLAEKTGIYVLARNIGGATDEAIEKPAERFRQIDNWYLQTSLTWKR